MHESDDFPDDSLDAILGVNDRRRSDADALRGAVFARTIGLMRRRRRVRQTLLVGGLLSCYLAGMATMGIWRTAGPTDLPASDSPVATAQPRSEQPSPATQPKRATRRPTAPRSAVRPAEMAQKSPTPFEGWRNIGDHYLQQSGDIAMATESYAQAMNLATDEELKISLDRDNWLLMALKDARSKEKNREDPKPN